jgi:predicted amidohydrolase
MQRTVRVAAVQAAALFQDREATTEKAVVRIAEVGKNGAERVELRETFIPCHPTADSVASEADLCVRLCEQAVERRR